MKLRSLFGIGLLHGALLLQDAAAGQRRFAFSYEAEPSPKGYLSYEQWVTWRADKDSNGDFSQFRFRHELEWGVTDKLLLGFYLADWQVTNGTDDDGAEFQHAGVEAIYNILNPDTDPVGLSLYGEVLLGPEEFELEGKVLLQKDAGPFSFVYNAVLEAKWEDDYSETEGEWKNTFGVSYQITPQFFIGAEAVHEVAFAEWEEAGDHVVYIGPNFSFRSGRMFATIAPLFQVTDVADEPNFETRLIFGIRF